MYKLFLITALSLSSLFGCNSNSPELMQDMDVSEINKNLLTIQKNNLFTDFSVVNLLEELNFIMTSSQSISVDISKSKENGYYTASVVNSEVPGDDSVSGYKYQFVLEIDDNGFWKVIEAKESWACWPDRGHHDFSIEPCP